MKFVIFILGFFLFFNACEGQKTYHAEGKENLILSITDSVSFLNQKDEINELHKEALIAKDSPLVELLSPIKIKDSTTVRSNVKIDSVSINEIKRYVEEELPNIFAYYKQERTDEYSIWSEKLFGRCCSNTDISFNENLFFKITSNIENEKYPISNLSDNAYLTTYAFKENSEVKISLKLDKEQSFLQGKYSNKNLLKPDEIIMNPIRLSLVNGYVKSQELYHNNGSVRKMEVYVNNEYKQTVILKDTPLVQELRVNAIFRTNDVITLVPKSYYYGVAYDDVCISEIQTNLGETAVPSLNKKFDLIELMNKRN